MYPMRGSAIALLIVLLALAGTSLKMSLAQSNTTTVLPASPSLSPSAWPHLSTANGDLPIPGRNDEQTAAQVLDVDKDGVNDFVIGVSRTPGPGLVWYRYRTGGWDRYLIESEAKFIEAGGATYDLDNDGDLDVVMGGDGASNQIWWWENPYPTYDPDVDWTRYLIKDGGASKHHDMMFGDFDGDGQAEFVFWNQGAKALQLAEIPADPRTSGPWNYQPVYRYPAGAHEGLAQADIDLDGILDIVGGGRWYKHISGDTYQANVIDDAQRFTRAATGQFVAGGRPEVVFVAGDVPGPLVFYQWNGTNWVGKRLLDDEVYNGHSLEVGDVNGDGHLDLFVAEMKFDPASQYYNPDAKMWFFLGDSQGNFTTILFNEGYGNHESRLADLDGDGDLDVLGKPYTWDTPRLDIWLNDGQGPYPDGCPTSALASPADNEPTSSQTQAPPSPAELTRHNYLGVIMSCS